MVAYESSAGVEGSELAGLIAECRMTAKNRRRIFERRWYDNNFFDDGFHFRYLSRSSNKIVDLSERSTIYTPQRSIPKASRQIRGIMNLLLSSDPTPSVYPEVIRHDQYPDIVVPQRVLQEAQQAGQQIPPTMPNPNYQKAIEAAKDVAQKRGLWLENEWVKDDGSGESILDKLALMTLLTMKHGVSYMKIWADEHDERIRTSVRDAFDVYLLGNYTSIYETPFILEAVPQLIATIKANPLFDPDQVAQLNPDNKKADSEIKEAYQQARYGRDTSSDQSATIIQNECFVQEYVSRLNADRIKKQEDGEKILKKRDIGSPVIRHVFTAGGVTLYDEYTNLDEYPYVDYRVEPGPIYHVPMIERFMPANKSLDSVVSRVERYTHTMVTGAWLKRRGENFKINNIAGGQILEYDATPPTQAEISPIPPFVYEFIGLLTNFIEEQGVSTTTLGKLPSGVKANAAIESLKESEYANLVVASRRLKSTVKKLAQKMFAIADENFISPQEVITKNKNEYLRFNVIGNQALKSRKKLKVDTPDVVPLAKDVKLDVEISQGMAYTMEGRKATMQQVIETMLQYVQAGAIPVNAVQSVIRQYLETYQFGDTEQFFEDFDDAMKQGAPTIADQTLKQMQIALLQALKDSGEIGQEASQKRITENKLGVLQALKDANLIKPIQQPAPPKPLTESLNIAFKDLPEDSKNMVLGMIGLPPSQMVSPSASQQIQQHSQAIKNMTPPVTNTTNSTRGNKNTPV